MGDFNPCALLPMTRIISFIVLSALIITAGSQSLVQAAEPPRITVGRMRVQLTRTVNQPPAASLSPQTLHMDTANDGSGRYFFAELTGRVQVRQTNGSFSTFLNLTSEVALLGPRGLLGMTFHPGYADPISPGYRKLYTYHTVETPATEVPVDFAVPGSTVAHHNVLTEWQVSASDPNVIDPSTRREVFREAHVDPQGIHNGGMLEFGPDGYLYGTIGTPSEQTALLQYSQSLATIQGKIFRIDPVAPAANPASLNPVSTNGKYRIPSDNPFVDDLQYPSALDEIYALGGRHIHRFSFDSETGLFLVGDVGQAMREEVSVVTAGANLGWPYFEGTKTGLVAPPNPAPVTELPLIEYTHATDGRTVVGGHIYRGSIAALQGKYIFGEFSWGDAAYIHKGRLFYADIFDEVGNLLDPSEVRVKELLFAPSTCAGSSDPGQKCSLDIVLMSLPEDDDGELYALGFGPRTILYKIDDAYLLPEGDYNEDGKVDAADYTVWRDSLGTSVLFKANPQQQGAPVEGYGTQADGDGDGVVDLDDYAIWKAHFGESVNIGSGSGAESTAVPEPSSCLMALISAGLTACLRRRTSRVNHAQIRAQHFVSMAAI